jgi:hypothetical protein
VTEENPSNRFSFSFEKKNLVAAVGIVLVALALAAGPVASQVSSGTSVSIGGNGIDVFAGELDLNSQDITSLGSILDGDGDTVASVNDNQNSVEMQGGFQLPTGTDAYN